MTPTLACMIVVEHQPWGPEEMVIRSGRDVNATAEEVELMYTDPVRGSRTACRGAPGLTLVQRVAEGASREG